MQIYKPIFIIGIQRSGTTILDNLFTRHKDTAFFEDFCNIYYKTPWLFGLIPLQSKLRRCRPESREGRVWRKFFTEIEYLDESQVSDKIKEYYYSAIRAELKAFQSTRFVNKNPAHCLRIRWLNAMFPEAYYVLIWRDPKSVVNSIYNKMLAQWKVESVTQYEHGYKGYVTVKETFGKDVSKLEACINYYNYIRTSLLKDLPIIEKRTTEVQYEQFIADPRGELKRLYEFSELQWYEELNQQIPDRLKDNKNKQWHSLPADERRILEEAFN